MKRNLYRVLALLMALMMLVPCALSDEEIAEAAVSEFEVILPPVEETSEEVEIVEAEPEETEAIEVEEVEIEAVEAEEPEAAAEEELLIVEEEPFEEEPSEAEPEEAEVQEAEPEAEMPEILLDSDCEHSYTYNDEMGYLVCDKCGDVIVCEHLWGKLEISNVGFDDYIMCLDTNRHYFNGDRTDYFECLLCGALRYDYDNTRHINGIESHNMLNGVCTTCGYDSNCKHEFGEVYEEDVVEKASFVSGRPALHYLEKTTYQLQRCTKCGYSKTLKKTGSFNSIHASVEKWNFTVEGYCDCCGLYHDLCPNHDCNTDIVEYCYDGKWEDYEQSVEPYNSEYHKVTGEVDTCYVCSKCSEVVERFQDEAERLSQILCKPPRRCRIDTSEWRFSNDKKESKSGKESAKREAT